MGSSVASAAAPRGGEPKGRVNPGFASAVALAGADTARPSSALTAMRRLSAPVLGDSPSPSRAGPWLGPAKPRGGAAWAGAAGFDGGRSGDGGSFSSGRRANAWHAHALSC